MKWKLIIPVLLISFGPLIGQQTLGTFINLPSAHQGYTLISPSAYNESYLIDNCGNLINQWTSNHTPGVSSYLLENGQLLRTARINGSFNGGGVGGKIEIYDWDGELAWSYTHASPDYHQHHDVAYLPNGNILILAWELRSREEAIQAGRNPATTPNNGIWSEQIIEVKPMGTNNAEIVWEWHLWDHLIQDFDNTKDNFGIIADHPELLDINADQQGTSSDWIHANSLDYNPVLDQIMFSSRTMNEIYVIDHSTTSEEAASHQGGLYGKGGDFIYRWGNPQNYDRGSLSDQKLFGQHDAHWIPYGLEDERKIMIFNNGGGRPDGTYSSIDIIEPPIDNGGNYVIESKMAYGPQEPDWSYTATPPASFFAQRVSGAQRLSNGHTLICEGTSGLVFEVDENLNTVWKYVNPVDQFGSNLQESFPSNNSLFRAYRYDSDYPAFEGKDLTPGAPLELNPIDYGCVIHNTSSDNYLSENLDQNIKVLHQIGADVVKIENLSNERGRLVISTILGQVVWYTDLIQTELEIQTHSFLPGMYIILFSKNGYSPQFLEKILIH